VRALRPASAKRPCFALEALNPVGTLLIEGTATVKPLGS